MPNSKLLLTDWLFRGLMFEADAVRFRDAGIRVGADIADVERSLLEQSLSPFSVDLRNNALQMVRVYAIMYCFENAVRELIRERLQEAHGVNWWSTAAVPRKTRSTAESRKEASEKQSWLEGQKGDLLGFVDFGGLADIIVENWEDFSDLIPSQHWLRQRMEELEQARNFIAHNRLLLPGEFQRIEMYVGDWNRMVGL